MWFSCNLIGQLCLGAQVTVVTVTDKLKYICILFSQPTFTGRNDSKKRDRKESSRKGVLLYMNWNITSNFNQKLWNVSNKDWRLKHFCCAVLCVSLTWQLFKTCMIRLRVIEGPNTHDQIVLCAFHSFWVEVQMNAGYMHVQYMLSMQNNNLGQVVRSWVKITYS